MKHRIRKPTSLLLSLSLISALTLPAAASNALGEDLSAKDTLLHQETQLSTNVFWSTTYSDLRTENLITYTPAGCNEWALGDAAAEQAAKDGSWANDFKHISYQESKSSNDTPRMEIDWIRFYKKPTYDYFGSGTPTRNKPMY